MYPLISLLQAPYLLSQSPWHGTPFRLYWSSRDTHANASPKTQSSQGFPSAGVSSVSDVPGEKLLNLGFTDWDTREHVLENRRRFQSALGATDLTLVTL